MGGEGYRRSLSDAAPLAEQVVVQEDLADPLLAGGQKFDLHRHVLATSRRGTMRTHARRDVQ